MAVWTNRCSTGIAVTATRATVVMVLTGLAAEPLRTVYTAVTRGGIAGGRLIPLAPGHRRIILTGSDHRRTQTYTDTGRTLHPGRTAFRDSAGLPAAVFRTALSVDAPAVLIQPTAVFIHSPLAKL